MSTPLMIHIAIWYYCRVGDYGRGTGDNNYKSEAVQETLKSFLNGGLIELTGDTEPAYKATDALRAWVDALCSVPFPVQKWVMPDGWEKALNH